jgi:hypothetical protein
MGLDIFDAFYRIPMRILAQGIGGYLVNKSYISIYCG